MSDRAEDKSGVEASTYDIVNWIKDQEREVNRLKALFPFGPEVSKPALVTFRGLAKLLVPVDELERSIEDDMNIRSDNMN